MKKNKKKIKKIKKMSNCIIENNPSLNIKILEKQAIKILIEMVINRDYKIIENYTEIDELPVESHSQSEYIPVESHSQSEYILKCEKNNKIILCFLCKEDKLNIQGIKDKMTVMNRENANQAIIIYREGVTPSVKKSFETSNYVFELFNIKELQINITQHRLVPKHEKVPMEESFQKIKDKIPNILSTDAISRYYNFQRGDIIKITRKDGSIIYRLVK